MTKEQTPLPPLVSDMELSKASWRSTSVTAAARELTVVRDIYEADRQRTREVVQANRELIQSWVDALGDALKSFEAAGYTPTPKP